MTDVVKNFMEGKLKQLPGETPTYNDWDDHLTTLFPQVRLKNYLELRSMDACSWNEICAQPAFWTGLLYDQDILIYVIFHDCNQIFP